MKIPLKHEVKVLNLVDNDETSTKDAITLATLIELAVSATGSDMCNATICRYPDAVVYKILDEPVAKVIPVYPELWDGL